jgi:hypothetical protein
MLDVYTYRLTDQGESIRRSYGFTDWRTVVIAFRDVSFFDFDDLQAPYRYEVFGDNDPYGLIGYDNSEEFMKSFKPKPLLASFSSDEAAVWQKEQEALLPAISKYQDFWERLYFENEKKIRRTD